MTSRQPTKSLATSYNLTTPMINQQSPTNNIQTPANDIIPTNKICKPPSEVNNLVTRRQIEPRVKYAIASTSSETMFDLVFK